LPDLAHFSMSAPSIVFSSTDIGAVVMTLPLVAT
jgi:hypothetical protein